MDIDAALRRAVQWCRGARSWVKVGLVVFGLCVLGSFAAGISTGSMIAVAIEVGVAAVGFPLVFVLVRWRGGNCRVPGMMARCAVPVVLFPITSAAIWGTYGSLLAGRGWDAASIPDVSGVLNGIDMTVTLALLIWFGAAIVICSKELRVSWFTLEGLRIAAALLGLVVLSLAVGIAVVFPLVGGDGMGP